MKMMNSDLSAILEDEWYLVRHSGETPEIALHSAIYYLTRAKDGPLLILSSDHQELLLRAAIDRFREIILRDLLHVNCGTTVYRGIHRSIVNYRRFLAFCRRQQIDPDRMNRQVAAALDLFLTTELAEMSCLKRSSFVNCTFAELQSFASELNFTLTDGQVGIAEYCLPEEEVAASCGGYTCREVLGKDGCPTKSSPP
jgi:hypothetical protein